MLPKTSAYVKRYDGQAKWMYFLIGDDYLLNKYNTIQDKVLPDIKKEFGGEPIYDKEFLKSKVKSHANEITDFHNKKMSEVDSNHTCLAVTSLGSGLK